MIATADVVVLSVMNIHAPPGEPQANHHETYAERADAPLLVEDVNHVWLCLSGIKKDQALPDLFASKYLLFFMLSVLMREIDCLKDNETALLLSHTY